jgi:hypothetical protein
MFAQREGFPKISEPEVFREGAKIGGIKQLRITQ